jgi:hypothetical protein
MSSNVKVLEDAEALSNVSVVDFTQPDSVNIITNTTNTNAISVDNESTDENNSPLSVSPISPLSPLSVLPVEHIAEQEEDLPPLPTQLPADIPVIVQPITEKPVVKELDTNNNINNNDIVPVFEPVLNEPKLDEPIVTELKSKSSNVEIVKNEIATMDTPSTDQKFQDNLEFCYNRLVELVHGTKYSITNWSLLIIKALKCVSHVKGLTAHE